MSANCNLDAVLADLAGRFDRLLSKAELLKYINEIINTRKVTSYLTLFHYAKNNNLNLPNNVIKQIIGFM